MNERERILAYRDSLRIRIRQLCAAFMRETRNGKKKISDIAAGERLFEIHVEAAALRKFTAAVVADHNLYDQDARLVSEAMTEAFVALEAANGLMSAKSLAGSLEAATRRKGDTLIKVQLRGCEVLV